MVKINLGKYWYKYYITNIIYNDICDKIITFVEESGVDPYDRTFLAEPLIDFAIDYYLTGLSVEEIYRRYVNFKLGVYDTMLTIELINKYEIEDSIQTFQLI